MTAPWAISEIVIPASADAPDAADFRAIADLANEVCLLDAGTDDLSETAVEYLSRMQTDEDEVHKAFVVREDGDIVGALTFGYSIAEPTSVEFDVLVLPQHYGRGIEDALLQRAEAETRVAGRAVMQCWTLHPGSTTLPTITPATGFGVIAETRLAALLLANGFSLEQVERNSAFDLQAPMDDVQKAFEQAKDAAGSDYRLVEWTIPTPPEMLDGYAWALSRMSTDAPNGGLEVDEETWDAARVQRREKRIIDGDMTMSVAAVQHVPSGAIAGFNELTIGADPAGVTNQFNTLVLREHRGHRLGMLVKCANLLRWHELAPLSPRVTTFNAEENRPMLEINEKIGFVPVSYAGAWQKKLQDHPGD